MPKDKPSAYVRQIAREVSEKVEVKRRLKRKYPQMYKPGWGKTKKKKGLLRRIKSKITSRTATVEAAASSQMGKRESLGKELKKLRRKSGKK